MASSVMNLSSSSYGGLQHNRTTSSTALNLAPGSASSGVGPSAGSCSHLTSSSGNTPHSHTHSSSNSAAQFDTSIFLSGAPGISSHLSGQSAPSHPLSGKVPLQQHQQSSSSSTGQGPLQTTPSSSTSSLQSLSNYAPAGLLKQQALPQQTQPLGSLSTNGYGHRLAGVTPGNPTMNQIRGKSTILQLNSGQIGGYGVVTSGTPTASNGVTNVNVGTGNVQTNHYLQLNPQHSKMWISQPTLGANNQPQTGSQIRSMMNLNQMATGQVSFASLCTLAIC